MTGLSLVTLGFVSKTIAASTPGTQTVVVVEKQVPAFFTQELQPVPIDQSEVLGIHQSDVIIKSAIIAGLADLRARTWLLDGIFASLPRDPLTMSQYGEKEVQRAKKWFLTTDIPVFMDYRPGESKLPCISIQLGESSEAENTLADTHYQPSEETDATWPILFGPFNPISYNISSGVMVVPDTITQSVFLNTDMYVVDRVGNAYPIIEKVNDTTLKIDSMVPGDFSEVTIRSNKPILKTSLESLSFKETYRIGCHSLGEPVNLTYLHSIMTFVLLAYKEVLLEGRGFERSVISSSDFVRNQNLDVELAYSRFITITGYVRNYWPKTTTPRIQGTIINPLQISAVGHSATKFIGDPSNTDDNPWYAELDPIGLDINKKV